MRGSVSFRERVSIFRHLVGFLNLNDHDFALPRPLLEADHGKEKQLSQVKREMLCQWFCRAAELHISL